MTDCPGYEFSIPGQLAAELREEIRAGRMTFNQFDHRVAEELRRTGPLPLMRFLYETLQEDE
jgi:hypothetical protein